VRIRDGPKTAQTKGEIRQVVRVTRDFSNRWILAGEGEQTLAEVGPTLTRTGSKTRVGSLVGVVGRMVTFKMSVKIHLCATSITILVTCLLSAQKLKQRNKGWWCIDLGSLDKVLSYSSSRQGKMEEELNRSIVKEKITASVLAPRAASRLKQTWVKVSNIPGEFRDEGLLTHVCKMVGKPEEWTRLICLDKAQTGLGSNARIMDPSTIQLNSSLETWGTMLPLKGGLEWWKVWVTIRSITGYVKGQCQRR
jgi:hypothetical protein